jgi:arylsulfatase A-like enzyme
MEEGVEIVDKKNWTRREFLRLTGAGAAGAVFSGIVPRMSVAGWPVSNPGDKPNIILVLADDLGYSDLGIQGCPDIPTPNIDSIGRNGVRFTQGYVSCPLCAPTRAGLLSGRYQQRFGFEHNPGPANRTDDIFGLPLSETTMAERLKSLGYVTGMVGKWHLGFKPELQPTKRGFDEFFGFLDGGHAYLPGPGGNQNPIMRGTQPVEEKEYLTDAFAREAVAFIERHKEQHFFLYLPFNAVHAPLQATEKYLSRFPSIQDGRRRTHAAMLSALDDAVGGVLVKLRAAGLEEKTLIVFLGDNGGPTQQTTSSNAPLRGVKGQVLEGGIRIPFLMQWKRKIPGGKVDDRPIISLDIYATFVAAAGAAIDSGWKLDGENLIPYLAGEKAGTPRETLFWRMGAQWAVRSGSLKLVSSGMDKESLFDLAADPGEAKNLAAERPEEVKKLKALYDGWNAQMAEPKWKPAPLLKLNPNQRAALPQPGQVQGWFDRLDKNADGELTPDEFPRPVIFRMMDANSDGAVTLDEARNFIQKIRR